MPEKETINIGSRRELFVDEFLLDERDSVRLRLHEPEPREVAVVTDHRWEGRTSGMATVIPEHDRVRLYYYAFDVSPDPSTHNIKDGDTRDGWPSADTHPVGVACAESPDGLRWHKPEVGAVTFEGNTQNNLVWLCPRNTPDVVGRFAPMRDTHPEVTPDAAYKALGQPRRAAWNKRLFALKSPDGYHWEMLDDEPVMTGYMTDSLNTSFYDPQIGAYRAYVRDTDTQGRAIRSLTSEDYRHWHDEGLLEYPQGCDVQLYTNSIIPYPRAPHIYVGFPVRYINRSWSHSIELLPRPEKRRLLAERTTRLGSALSEALFMSSRDGKTWERWDEAFLRPGPQQDGDWFYGDNFVAWGMVPTESPLESAPPELSLYVQKNYRNSPGVHYRRYAIRQDGFVSLNAPFNGGTFTTRPIIFSGDTLRLNMATAAAGHIAVEIQDAEGHPIEGHGLEECDPVIGNELDRPVTWNGDSRLQVEPDTPVRLRFFMSDADVFAMRFAPVTPEG